MLQMKKICFLFFALPVLVFPHKEPVHQHLVREAYKLLKSYIGQDIREMKDHVGYNQEGSGQFNPGGLMVIGAFQEDNSDATNEGYGFSGWFVSNTHFWDPDYGDNSVFTYINSYTNAYQKALKYLYGGYELRVPYPANGITEAYEAPSDLINFYKTRRIYYKGYYDITGQYVARNRWSTVSNEFRDKVVWEIVGRICHLLGDMSVPAHTHRDPHPPTNPDSYEEWMNYSPVYNTWTFQNAITQGGLIDVTQSSIPIKYLFYTTAQLSGFFASNDVGGNNVNTYWTTDFSAWPSISVLMQDLTSSYGGTPPSAGTVMLSDISNNAFVYGIRSIAGFLHWFSKEAGLLPIPITGVTVSGTETLYQGATGVWGANAQNGLEPFTYNWQIKYVDGGGYLQSYTSVKAEKEKKDKEKKKDGEIIIALAPSNEWVPLYVNSDVLTRPHNPTDLRDYYLKCSITDASGTTKTSNEWYVDVTTDLPPQMNSIAMDNSKLETVKISLENEVKAKEDFSDLVNYPNPFNPSTQLSFTLKESGLVSLRVYNTIGKEVANLADGYYEAGKHTATFDGSNLASGIYFYRLTTPSATITKKMMLVK